MEPVLRFNKISKKYGDFDALKDVSFEVQPGEFFALLGPNGAGKTTLINCLAGVTDRTSGDISVMGVDPAVDPTFTKTKLGIVEQEITADPFFTPIEIMRLRRGLFGLKPNDDYLDWILEKLDLSDKRDAKSRNLSGGMKRRLMIAKALAHDPEVIILDEPTAGVDVELRHNLYDFIQELRREKGKTILLTTHYLEEAEEFADRVAIQQQGKILVCDTTKNLLKANKRMMVLETCNGHKERIEVDNDNINLKKIVKDYPTIKNIRVREPRLEEVFLKFTKKK